MAFPTKPATAGNQYDQALADLDQQQPAPAAKPNIYEQTLAEQDNDQQQRIRTSIAQSADVQPDRAAEARKLAEKLNIPQSIVERNYDRIVSESKVRSTPYQSIISETPKLAETLENPDNAKVMHDDLEPLGALEWLMTAPQRGFAQGMAQIDVARLRTLSLQRDLTREEQDQLDAARFYMGQGGALGASNSWFRKAVSGAASQLPILFGATLKGLERGIPAGVTTGTMGAMYGGPAGGVLTFGAGMGAGMLAGGAEFGFMLEAGLSYDEYLGFKDELGRTIDPDAAKAAAVATGVMNAGLEAFGLERFLAAIPGVDRLVGSVGRSAVKQALRQPTVRAALAEAMKGYAGTLTTETAVEVAQRAMTIMSGELAKIAGGRQLAKGQTEAGNVDLYKQPTVANPDGTSSTVDSLSVNIDGQEVLLPTVTPDGRHFTGDTAAQQATEEYQKTGKHLGKFDSPESATAYAQQLHDAYAQGTFAQGKSFRRGASDIAADLGNEALGALQSFALMVLPGPALHVAGARQQAQRAAQNEAFFKALAEGVQQSKTLERAPGVMQEYLQKLTKDGPIENLYVPVESWSEYWQKQGVNPAEAATEILGDPDAFDTAIRTGEDLQIPTATYAVKLAPTEHNAFFAQEMRMAPGEMNAREAAQFFEEQKALADTAPQEPAAQSPGEQIQASLVEQLTQAGVERSTAENYAQLYGSTLVSMAERAGVDPVEMFKSYGLQVKREDLQTPPPERPAALKEAAAKAPEEGAAARAAGADVPATAAAQALEAQRNAPPVELTPEYEPYRDVIESIPGLDVKTMGPAELLKKISDYGPMFNGFINNDAPAELHLSTDQQTAVLQQTANGANNRGEQKRAILAWARGHLENVRKVAREIVDKNAAQAENQGAGNAEAEQVPSRRVDQARSPAGNRVAAIEPGAGAKGEARAAKHFERLREAVLSSARLVDPNVDEARLASEFEFRLDYYLEQRALAADSGYKPHDILRAVAKLGGISTVGEREAEIKDLGTKFGAVAGIRGVFRKPSKNFTGNQQQAGHPIDVMLQMLQSDPQFSWIENIDMLMDQIDEAARHGVDVISTSELPGTDELRDVGVRLESNWWADRWQNQDLLNEVSEADLKNAGGTTSYDQLLFDELQPKPASDKLDTGEQQPRLPGDVGDVRNEERKQGQFDAPFSLTAPVAKGQQSKQTTLFQGVTQADADAFTQRMKEGNPNLEVFDLRVLKTGDVRLDSIGVRRTGTGVGAVVMHALTRWADQHQARLVLGIAEKGYQPIEGGPRTSSESRLKQFYKRFGFVENKGRYKDFSLSNYDSMYREPTLTPFNLTAPTKELLQPFLHGSPHNFDRFSTEHIGTGEGAAAYGWGLYFAENPEVAVGYHRQLAEDPKIQKLKIGSMVLTENNNYDYSRRAGESNLENIRASLAEDLLIDEVGLRAAVAQGQQALEKHVLGVLDDKIAGYRTEWPEGVAAAEQLRKELARKGAIEMQLGGSPGGVYQVEIDDRHVSQMLNWDAPLKYQPENVRKALAEISPDHWDPASSDYDENEKGDSIYHRLIALNPTSAKDEGWTSFVQTINDIQGSQKAASMALAAHGVPGIRYFDQQSRPEDVVMQRLVDLHSLGSAKAAAEEAVKSVYGLSDKERAKWVKDQTAALERLTRNVVVFDEKIVKLTHKDGSPVTQQERDEYLQGDKNQEDNPKAPGRRGSIRFGADRQFTINLFERADLSTFLHESGHFYLEVFGDLVDNLKAQDQAGLNDQQRQVLNDYATLLGWFGVENREAIGEQQHEQFARGFEAYLMEGKAPSLELRSAFARFRAWLIGIYRSLANLRVEFTPEVRQVFDRMVASDQAIQDAESAAGVEAMFTDARSAGMSEAEFTLYRRAVQEASQTARETLERQMLEDVQREQQADYKRRRDEIKAKVLEEVNANPTYQALAAMQRGTKPDGSDLAEFKTDPLKLSRKMLVEQFGEERLKKLPRPFIYRADGGMDPEFVAGMFGFTSADAMLTAIEQAPAQRAYVQDEVNRRLLEQEGNLLLDGTLHEKATAAVAGEHREAVIRAELRALWKLQRQAAPYLAYAEEAVKAEKQEREYERRWFEAEAKLRIAIAEGRQQVEIDRLQSEVSQLKEQARRGAATINKAMPPAEVLRNVARERIARTKVGKLEPRVFLQAARRAGALAVDHAARQDFEDAIQAKQQELINMALYAEAQKMKLEVEKRIKAAQDLSTTAARKRLGLAGQEYLDQVDGILDRYDFARVSQKALDRRDGIRAWVQALESQGIPVDLPEEVLDDSRRTHFRDLTVEAFIGVTDGLQQILHLARLKNRLLKSAADRALQDVANSLATSIREKFKGTPKARSIETRLPTEATHRLLEQFFASHRKLASLAREMDGFEDGGAMWEAVIKPLNDAADREAEMNAKATTALGELVREAYPGREKIRLYEKVNIPAINQSLTKMGRIMVALNWGNDGNRQRIMSGYGWSEQQVEAVLETLDARDWKFIQGVWDFIDGYWEEIAKKQERVTGLAPEKVAATPVTTKFGTFKGGYFPIKYDDRQSAQVQGFVDLEAAGLQQKAAYVRATTRRGHTEARKAKVTLPVRLDFGPIFEHVQQVIHDLSHHEMLIDVGRILGHRDVQKVIYETYGDIIYRQFKDGIKDVAFGAVPAVTAFEKSINHLRTGATVAGLGWNITTSFLQPLGLTQSAVRIGPKWVARGIVRWLRSPKAFAETPAWIEERSALMRSRAATMQREINEIRNQVGMNTGKVSSWIDEVLNTTTLGKFGREDAVDSFFWTIQQMQRVADIPTWLGQYEKSMEAGETEERAIAIADQAVLDAQGGGQVKDLASVQRGGPLLRLWTNFYSFFNTTYNLAVESKRQKSVGRVAADYLMLFIIPATLGKLMRDALKGDVPEPDDDKAWGKWLVELARDNVSYPMGMLLGLRELSGAVEGYQGYEGPAGARAFSTASKLVKQVEQGDADAAFFRALNESAGILLHYPAGQVRRSIEGLTAIMEGKTANPLALVMGPSKEAAKNGAR